MGYNPVLICLIGLIVFVPSSLLRADTLDVFPLNEGAYFRYRYDNIYESYSILGFVTKRDSGLIEYHIRDSSHLPSGNIEWTIDEYVSFQHWETGSYIEDTIYNIYDTTRLIGSESGSGYHEIVLGGRLWKFPLILDLASISVYRFVQDSIAPLSVDGFCPEAIDPEYQYSFDTVNLEIGSGLSSRHWYLCYPGDDFFGSSDSGGAVLDSVTTAIPIEAPAGPRTYSLLVAYPNPFNPSTNVEYSLKVTGKVSLRVFNELGEMVRVLVEEIQHAGIHRTLFDGSGLPSGVYIVQLRGVGQPVTARVLLLR